MKRPLDGRTALVTGASGGIGRAIALAWAAQGGSLALVGRDGGALAEAAREAVAAGGARAEAWVADLAKVASVRALPERVRAEFGGLHALVHAAGLYAADGADAAETSLLWQVNAHAPLALSLGCRELLRESEGEIVFVNSSVVAGPAPGLAGYAASKRALAAIADSLRASFNAEGIRVLSVYPGRTATRMQRRVYELEGRTYRPERLLQPEDVASAVLNALLLPRSGEITDLHIRPFLKPE
jgi:NAD(P)-dependent dehydrogenase (short-subunit alcohol dehydrogenase family)